MSKPAANRRTVSLLLVQLSSKWTLILGSLFHLVDSGAHAGGTGSGVSSPEYGEEYLIVPDDAVRIS